MFEIMPYHRHTTSPLSLWDAFFDITHPTNFDFTFPMDVAEDEKKYIITAELPGVKPNDVSVTLKDGLLTIKGEKVSERNGEDCYCYERTYGSFSRTIRLPDNIKYEADMKAVYKDGVLTVEIPKVEVEEPKQIEIAVK